MKIRTPGRLALSTAVAVSLLLLPSSATADPDHRDLAVVLPTADQPVFVADFRVGNNTYPPKYRVTLFAYTDDSGEERIEVVRMECPPDAYEGQYNGPECEPLEYLGGPASVGATGVSANLDGLSLSVSLHSSYISESVSGDCGHHGAGILVAAPGSSVKKSTILSGSFDGKPIWHGLSDLSSSCGAWSGSGVAYWMTSTSRLAG